MQFCFQIVAMLIAIAVCFETRGEEPARELDTYMLVVDQLVERAADAPAEQVFHSSDHKLVTARLADYGQRFPDNVNFPQGGFFLLVISDHVRETFESLSMVDAKHAVVVDLKAEKDAAAPKGAAEGKKISRLFLVWTAPLNGVKEFDVKTGDGVRHEAKAEELKK